METEILQVCVEGGLVLAISPADLQQVVVYFVIHSNLQIGMPIFRISGRLTAGT